MALYDTWCYLPLAGFLTFDREEEQYLFCYMLRPGLASAKQGCLGMLKRLLTKLRAAFPDARIRVRLDPGFSGAQLYEFFEAEKTGIHCLHGKKQGALCLGRTGLRDRQGRCRTGYQDYLRRRRSLQGKVLAACATRHYQGPDYDPPPSPTEGESPLPVDQH